MNKVNELVLCKDDYKDEAEFYSAVTTAIKLLIDAGYILTVEWDEKGLGILRIKYNYADREYGCEYPYWLTCEQADMLYAECEREEDD